MLQAIVIGGGIAGLSAAVALAHAGYQVKLLEETDAFRPAGAALSLWGNGIAALDVLGVGEPIRERCASITAVTASSKSGARIMETTVDDPDVPEARIVTRAELHHALRTKAAASANILLGQQAVSVEQSESAAHVVVRDGSSLTADLVVVADGIASEIGVKLLGNPASSAGYGGILALSEVIHEPAESTQGSEFWAVGERLGIFNLRDGRSYWYHMLSGERADAPAEQHAALVAGIKAWPPEACAPILATPPDRFIPVRVWAKAPPKRLGAGRIIVVGDAAHAMEPNLGQGACQSLEDAAALMAIARRVPPAQILTLLERVRLERITRTVHAAGRRSRLVAQPANRIEAALGRLALAITPVSAIRRSFRSLHRLPDYDALAEALLAR